MRRRLASALQGLGSLKPTALGIVLAVGLAVGAVAQPVPVDTTRAQTDTLVTESAEDALEPLTDEEITGDPTELLELLTDLRENPLDLNAATADDLGQIPALSPILATRIVRFRAENGPFTSLPQLQNVEGITADVYLEARPYLQIGPRLNVTTGQASPFPIAPRLSQITSGSRIEVIQRLQRRLDLGPGFSDSLRADTTRTSYIGSPERVYTRIRATYRRSVSIGITLEKDPGEEFAFDPGFGSYGYDYLSFHASVQNFGRFESVVVGDFAAQYGQGVALWRASGFGKGRDALGPIRNSRGLRPYASVDENNFFRGVGATVGIVPQLYVSAFASRRTLDATIVEVDTTDLEFGQIPVGDAVATGIAADGLHRTASERAKKDALGETLFGGAVEGRFEPGDLLPGLGGRVGLVGYHARFDDPLGGGSRPDQRFAFSGDQITMASLYWDLRTRDFQAFGEVARAPGGSVGGLGGVSAELGGGAEAIVIARHFPADFTSIHGYAFGERNGATQNETGLYTGLSLKPSRAWTISAYFDRYRFPFLRFGVPRPSTGYEALAFVEHRPRRWLSIYLQARTETKEVGFDVPQGNGSFVGTVVPETRQSLRLHGEYLANRELRFRARLEGTRFVDGPTGEDSYGVLLYQDVRYQALEWLRVDTRVTFFDAETFGARLYQFENDLTGVFAIPVLSGRGTRAYALLTAQPIEGLSIQAKFAATVFEDRRTVGSGLNEVEGDTVRDVSLQVRYRF